MAKGQQKSNRETKKPKKTAVAKPSPATGSGISQLGKNSTKD